MPILAGINEEWLTERKYFTMKLFELNGVGVEDQEIAADLVRCQEEVNLDPFHR